MPELVQLADENDEFIKNGTREEAWATGLYCRMIFVLIEDEDSNILLQHRSKLKKLMPDRWTGGASGHVDADDTYESAANRELQEEAGLHTSLKFIGSFSLKHDIDNKLVRQHYQVFRGTVPTGSRVSFDPEEVSEVRWVSRDELLELVTHDELPTLALKDVVERFYR